MGKKQHNGVASGKSAGSIKKSMTMPSVSDMNSSIVGSSSTQGRLPQDNRLYLTCCCFSTCGGAYNADVFDYDQLIQVQMICAANPSPIFNLKQIVKLYKENTSAADGMPIPSDMDAVTQQYRAQFIFASKKTYDPDNVGFKKNRSGWYVSLLKLKTFLKVA